MEEEDTKLCKNCKREIPAVNFTTHSVHCARNIRNCPVCKEPVPVSQLQEHHNAMHKEVPCKKCGESVCGTDLEDHVRDSCARTIKPCRYCELELPRQELPAHEAYCGARSEQCPDCREYVMAKYRQLHLDSNHGFIRLDDDPTPKEEKPKSKLNLVSKPIPKSAPKPAANGLPAPSTSNGSTSPRTQTEIRFYETPWARGMESAGNALSDAPRATETGRHEAQRSGGMELPRSMSDVWNYEVLETGVETGKRTPKRSNDQPQVNTSVRPAEKVTKELPSRGAVKKRPAPPPPDPARDRAYHSAAARAQHEQQQRQQQTARNLAAGLPPVLSAAEKLDKLRLLDSLHNWEIQEPDRGSRIRGSVWQAPPDAPAGNLLGADGAGDFSHLQPMTAAQFMNRIQELHLGSDRRRSAPPGGAGGGEAAAGGAGSAGGAGGDRFSDIKTSLRELRRGLNEVTAPYNASSAGSSAHIDSNRLPPSPPPPPPPGPGPAGERLPCEFCARPVPADDLVLHQTGCRPDLARLPARRRAAGPREPVIPCEFCPRCLPVYLISEHQERCRREANLLYQD